MKLSIVIKVTIAVFLLLPTIYLDRLQAAPVSIINIQIEPYADVYVNQRYSSKNYDGSRSNLAVRSYADLTGSWNIRTLIAFDLSDIPPGSYVTYARLYLFMYDAPGSTRTYECDRIVNPWKENTVTWDNKPNVEGVSPKTATIGTISNVWVSWDVKVWVQNFVSGEISATPNYGWEIKDKEESSITLYESNFWSQESDTDLHPTLTMSYYPPHLELETYGSSFTAGNWVKMTVHRKDYNNISVKRGDLKVKLSSTSTSAKKKFSLTPDGATINELIIEDGTSSKDFWYYDEKTGSWTIRVWTTDYVGYGEDSKVLKVEPGSLVGFAFSSITSPKIAAVPFTITITAIDSYGNIVTSYTGINALTDTTGTITPTMTSSFINGVWSGDVLINKVANNVKISTSGGGKTGESNAFNIVAGPPAKLLITPSTFTVAAGIQYSSLTITLHDANDFVTTATTPLTINLATTSPDGEFRMVGTSNKVTSITITAGSSSASLDYYDMRGGTWTLTASTGGLISGTSSVTVIPDTTPPVTTLIVGSPKYQIGTTLYVGNSTPIELSASDEASGVRVTKYRIDGGSWNLYSAAFTLSSCSDGSHTIGYYSSDKAGNNESEKILPIFLDKTAPSIQASKPSGTVIEKSTSITFKVAVVERGSGIASVELVLDGTSLDMMTDGSNGTYTKVSGVAPGTHKWSAKATDNVCNIAQSPDIEFVLIVDAQPPTISNLAVVPSSPSWGELIRISATINDAISGVQEATIYYSTDGGASWSSLTMSAPMPPATSYEGTIPTQMPMTKVQFYIEATDKLGNVARSPTQEFTVAIPIWLYAILAVIFAVLIIGVARRRKPYPPPPPNNSGQNKFI